MEWLDLSCNNKIEWIDKDKNFLAPAIADAFPSLCSLYLHDTGIQHFKEIKAFQNLTYLRKLTLHGNPIQEKKDYRKRVVQVIPQLKSLDFSAITHQDRDNVQTWKNTHQTLLLGKRTEEY